MLKKAYAMNPQDAQVDAALRRMGIVPGPALKDRNALVKSPVPEGPIPPINEWTANRQSSTPARAGAQVTPQPSAQVPRD